MVTWLVVVLTWIIAYCFLGDWTVIDTNDPEEDDCIDEVSDIAVGMRSAKPMIRLHVKTMVPEYRSIGSSRRG